MIRINLLGVERHRARKGAGVDIGQRLTIACALILVAAASGIGWWYWTLEQASAQVDAEIVAAQQEQARLRSLLTEVTQFEARRAQLQQRVALIEQLRSGQSLPVQLLDHVSRSLPDSLWLTDLVQDGDAVTIEGRSMTLISLSDFVGNLGASPLLKKPIEIVNSRVEAETPTPGQPPVDVIQFTVKAQVLSPQAATPAAGRGAAPGAAR